mmetsp:Transcript_65745/g.172268  ORF Transcript_65745/g.172268 Transcript_65745/m.172268 type:complete len:81 (-) Transcript_65745:482-724(-)
MAFLKILRTVWGLCALHVDNPLALRLDILAKGVEGLLSLCLQRPLGAGGRSGRDTKDPPSRSTTSKGSDAVTSKEPCFTM